MKTNKTTPQTTPPPAAHAASTPSPSPAPSKDDASAPAHLSASSKALWAAVVPSSVRSHSVLACLRVALSALDRADQASAVIAIEGLTTKTALGLSHAHPLLKVEKDARQQFATIWRSVGLDREPVKWTKPDGSPLDFG